MFGCVLIFCIKALFDNTNSMNKYSEIIEKNNPKESKQNKGHAEYNSLFCLFINDSSGVKDFTFDQRKRSFACH